VILLADNKSVDAGKQDTTKPVLAGSVFIGNTSYSGADIKVLIHLYRDSRARAAADLAEMDLATNADWQDSVESQISKAEAARESVHRGTQEEQYLTSTINRLKKDSKQLETAIIDSQEQVKQAQKTIGQEATKVLAEAQTLSVSIYRHKEAVRACGSVYPKGFTRGPRQIAGSMVFTVFDEHVFYQFLEAHASDFDSNTYTSSLMDQLPPVDILISFANEYGATSRMTIYGVEFVDEGQVMSIEDILTENVVHFVARDIDPMRSVAQRTVDRNGILQAQSQPKRASDLLREEDYKLIKNSISPFGRFQNRRNPFL